MESLALFVTFMLITIVFLAVIALVLTVFSWRGKLHKAWGYSATGLLLLLTTWCFTIAVPLGMVPAVPLLVCLVLVGFPKKAK